MKHKSKKAARRTTPKRRIIKRAPKLKKEPAVQPQRKPSIVQQSMLVDNKHEVCVCGHCRCGHALGFERCLTCGCERWTWDDRPAPPVGHDAKDKFTKEGDRVP